MITDIAATSFWDRVPALKPYALLARWDRPVGIWLTLWPAIWSVALAPSFKATAFPDKTYLLLLFLIGAIAVRGAGCTINDIIDRRLDARVARTKMRPLASGQLSLKQAVIFLILQLVVGALVLFQLSPLAIMIGIAILPLIALYPLMKRITFLPQLFLGLVFNAGALIAWAAVENSLSIIPVLIYMAGFFWTLAYDTVYAHLDAADDAVIGVKSTARLWDAKSKTIILLFWTCCLICLFAAFYLSPMNGMGWASFALGALIMLIAHAYWKPSNSRYTLGLFRLQARIGLIFALAALAPVIFGPVLF